MALSAARRVCGGKGERGRGADAHCREKNKRVARKCSSQYHSQSSLHQGHHIVSRARDTMSRTLSVGIPSRFVTTMSHFIMTVLAISYKVRGPGVLHCLPAGFVDRVCQVFRSAQGSPRTRTTYRGTGRSPSIEVHVQHGIVCIVGGRGLPQSFAWCVGSSPHLNCRFRWWLF